MQLKGGIINTRTAGTHSWLGSVHRDMYFYHLSLCNKTNQNTNWSLVFAQKKINIFKANVVIMKNEGKWVIESWAAIVCL